MWFGLYDIRSWNKAQRDMIRLQFLYNSCTILMTFFFLSNYWIFFFTYSSYIFNGYFLKNY